ARPSCILDPVSIIMEEREDTRRSGRRARDDRQHCDDASGWRGSVHIGYAAMLEQFPPSDAVAYAELAERRGFSGVMATDHFQPWLPQQGEASHVWSVLGAI